MGCTSAKQLSSVPSDEEGRGKAYSNGDAFSDEYKLKGVEKVKYMHGEEERANSRNQENLLLSIKNSVIGRRRPMRCSPSLDCSSVSTLQRASRSSSRCWMRRLKRDGTTARRTRI
ncbi:uncharacterized protein C1orf21 homolog isoform X1 [Siphateles boraxobius]|uniref:uncharacterized protein C1orf21 homolog isoform X1 n=1 Tax=Siphateles boraxobius TaxID=180520 RepID=UPI0040634A34